MRRLIQEEVKEFAETLFFSVSVAKDITDLFYEIKKRPLSCWKVTMPLNNVGEYIREYENHWHTKKNIKECFEHERDYYSNYYLDEDIQFGIFENIEKFKEFSMGNENSQFVYQLPNNMVIVRR